MEPCIQHSIAIEFCTIENERIENFRSFLPLFPSFPPLPLPSLQSSSRQQPRSAAAHLPTVSFTQEIPSNVRLNSECVSSLSPAPATATQHVAVVSPLCTSQLQLRQAQPLNIRGKGEINFSLATERRKGRLAFLV